MAPVARNGPPPDPAAPEGESGFKFDRSGYRVPAIIASPWVESGSVYNDEYRHTSLIATLRKQWDLGEAFTQRDAAAARTFDHIFSREIARDPETWATFKAQPLPKWHMEPEIVGKAISMMGKNIGAGVIEKAKELGVTLPPQLADPSAELTPELIIEVVRDIGFHFFPLLEPGVGSS
jgi:phospholipase C